MACEDPAQHNQLNNMDLGGSIFTLYNLVFYSI